MSKYKLSLLEFSIPCAIANIYYIICNYHTIKKSPLLIKSILTKNTYIKLVYTVLWAFMILLIKIIN